LTKRGALDPAAHTSPTLDDHYGEMRTKRLVGCCPSATKNTSLVHSTIGARRLKRKSGVLSSNIGTVMRF